jgi:predicted HicB family RNase H-like nuclease
MPDPSEPVRTSVRLPHQLHETLVLRAKDMRVSVNRLLEAAVRFYLMKTAPGAPEEGWFR